MYLWPCLTFAIYGSRNGNLFSFVSSLLTAHRPDARVIVMLNPLQTLATFSLPSLIMSLSFVQPAPTNRSVKFRAQFVPVINQKLISYSIAKPTCSASAVIRIISKLPEGVNPKEISEGEWQTYLSPEQFRILRRKGTEYPGTGEYNKFYPSEGFFGCAGCGSPLYEAKTKFDSGCGWPAFYDGLPGAILEKTDPDGRRTEILCNNCGGHLGHIFKGEGFMTPTDARHCVNSISITYKKK